MDDLKIKYIMSARIGRLREIAGSTNALARITGAKPKTIRSWLNGESRPGLAYLIRLREKYGCTIDWMLGYSDLPHPSSATKLIVSTEDKGSAWCDRCGYEMQYAGSPTECLGWYCCKCGARIQAVEKGERK